MAVERKASPNILQVAAVLLTGLAVVVPPLARLRTPQRQRVAVADASAIPATYVSPQFHVNARRLALAEGVTVVLVLAVFAWMLLQMASAPVIYSDSGTVLSISRLLAQGDWAPVWDTQSPPLQDATYAALMLLNLDGLVHAPVLIGSFGLALVLGQIAYRVTGERAAFGLPTLILIFSPVIWVQATQLPFYAIFALLGYLGFYVGLRAMFGSGSVPQLLLGGALIALSVYAFTLALTFFVVPALALAFFFSRDRLVRTAQLYGGMIAVAAPWILWHLTVGGVKYFHYHPLNWFSRKYAALIVPQFWGNGLDVSFAGYVRIQLDVLRTDLIDPWVLALAIPGVLFVSRRFGPRAAAFVVACVALHVVLLLATRPSAHARYHFPILPLLVLLCAGGLYWLSTSVAKFLREGSALDAGGLRGRHIAVLLAASVAVFSLVSPPSPFNTPYQQYVVRAPRSPAFTDLDAMAHIIEASDGGVIARDSALQQLVPDNQVFTPIVLTEDEYVTFLSWPSDSAVAATLNGRNIEWIVIRNNPLRWERDYNAWLQVAYGVRPQHYLRVAESPAFEEAYSGVAFQLFRLKPTENLASSR